MDKILIIGASGHAKVVVEAVELVNEYEIQGFIDTYKKSGDMILGYEILGDESILKELSEKGIKKGVIAIGDNWVRSIMYKRIVELVPDFEFITVIHPGAILSPYSTIGKGTVILASGTVNTHATIGDFCIINTNANLGHDSIMEDFSSLAPGVTTGGTVLIGEFTAVSLGVVILQNISIGSHNVIGAGALVTKNIEDFTVSYGIPAKTIRKRKKGESYLNSMPANINFAAYEIKTEKDLEVYKDSVETVYGSNPFYKIELLDTTNMNAHQLCYFVLSKSDTTMIMMPFFKRQISVDGKLSEYNDVISPYGYSGPLYDSDKVDESLIKYFWKQVDIWYQKNNIVSEFIRFSLNGNHEYYNGVLIPSLKNVKGKIIEKEEQWKKFKPKVRNNHRKAVDEELKLKIYQQPMSIDIVQSFYNIYIETMRRNNAHSLYFHDIDYFKNFIFNNPDSSIIAMIYKDDQPISTELILIDNSTLYSYLGGTLSDYFYTRPNDFLKIEVMNWARENNYEYYVLGGGRVDQDGLYKYKKSFFPNDEDVIYCTGRKVVDEEKYLELIEQKINDIDSKDIDVYSSVSYFPLYRRDD
ncbi:NeuD/PglB/VioB family sugar acetyltransferase [uncultured Aquimarina sp.]|uniref:NeuD/PglB/VioB family sugar acetyltransferase n=1 Tax=uncultured Aquimarina sp. TaxID=575652 RepID=UPI00261B4884|nr:NeuD/PglB/VioB family sugar acetyltransferase [uncultured Aquimarina sp.]